MEPSAFNEIGFFRSIHDSGARALLIGRRTLRYVLENDEHVDVLVAHSVTTVDGHLLQFDALWDRHESIDLENGVSVAIPSLDDLILTKQIQPRPKDLEDIRLLRALREEPGR